LETINARLPEAERYDGEIVTTQTGAPETDIHTDQSGGENRRQNAQDKRDFMDRQDGAV